MQGSHEPQAVDLCEGCRRLSFADIQQGYLMHAHFDSLIASSVSCRMCALVRDRLHNTIKQYIHKGAKDRNQNVMLMPHEAPGIIWVRALNLKLGELWIYKHPGLLKLCLYCTFKSIDVSHRSISRGIETMGDRIFECRTDYIACSRKDFKRLSLQSRTMWQPKHIGQ